MRAAIGAPAAAVAIDLPTYSPRAGAIPGKNESKTGPQFFEQSQLLTSTSGSAGFGSATAIFAPRATGVPGDIAFNGNAPRGQNVRKRTPLLQAPRPIMMQSRTIRRGRPMVPLGRSPLARFVER